ncbi:histidine kinase [Caulobacter sp. 73W]|uniref:Histidine kinase n=1 Tax=Caulobacter sp. 73W TaxID=3161137 RepID=A0AB39KTH7_9CAUL
MTTEDFVASGAARRRDWLVMPALAIGYWLAIEVWANALNYLNGMPLAREYWLGEIPVVAIGAILNILQWRAVRWASRGSRWLLWATTFVTVVVFAMAYSSALRFVELYTPVMMPELKKTSWVRTVWDTIYFSSWFVLWVAIVATFESERVAQRRERQLASALITAREAEIRALHYQINPHFLYNTLNAISALILDRRNTAADQMVVRLAAFFRGALAKDPLQDVRLEEEVALQRLYLDIERVRFEALKVEVDIPAELLSAQVPSLILQPIIENAVKHGVNDPERETLIAISAWSEDDVLFLKVQDDGPSADGVVREGTGMENIRRRLAARFGRHGRVDVKVEPGVGFVATLVLPLCVHPKRTVVEK